MSSKIRKKRKIKEQIWQFGYNIHNIVENFRKIIIILF